MWKDVKGFEKYYKISNDGRIYSKLSKRELKVQNNGKGYLFIRLVNKTKFYVHRLVAINFIDNPNNLPQVNHIDGDKSNNNDWNLEWCTNKQNQIHSVKIGLSDNIKKLRKLSFTQIKEIYESLNNGISRKELALKYNVSLQVISNIRTRKGILYKKIGLKENQLVDNLT